MKFENPIDFEKRLREELNPPQFEAVTYTGGPLLILAGAGSGKTRVIAYRIAYLMKVKQLAPWNILAVTFTNKAANEMRERVISLTEVSPRGLWVGTFHALCARILRQDGKTIGIDPTFSIYDRADQLSAVKRVLASKDWDKDKKITPGAILNEISRAKNKFIWPEPYHERAQGGFEQTVATVYQEYQTLLRENNALDFDDILLYAVRLLTSSSQIGDVYRTRFQQILVDEYQDTNHPQYLFLRELAHGHQQICVVGDDDQSIYRWRGADIQNILNFSADYSSIHTVRLEQNYRCSKNILAAASHIVSHNEHRHHKELFTQNEDGEKVGVVNLPDGESEAFWIGETIQKLHEQEQIPFGDFAIFYRVNAQSRLFEEECIRRAIPYSIVGATAFYERREVKDMLAYARLLINPADQVSFDRIINLPKRKLGSVSVRKLMDFATCARLPIVKAALKTLEAGLQSGLSLATQKAFHDFGALFERWQAKALNVSLADLLRAIFQESGYEAMLKESRDLQDEARVENVQELINAAGMFEEDLEDDSETPRNTLLTLQNFLENTSLVSDVDNLNETEDKLVLMTVHGAKGLEFPIIFLAGMEDGLFPHQRAIQSNQREDIEEERRLCYVGITRAKRRVFLTHASSRRLYNQREMAFPSRFIGEIPEKYIEHISWSTFTPPSDNFTIDSEYFEPQIIQDHHFVPGDTVIHRTFGLGVVLAVDGAGNSAHIRVDFQSVGKKVLVQEFARLLKA